MIIVRIIVLIIIFLIIWLPLDFYIGRRLYIKKVQQHVYPKRSSNIELYTYGNDLYKQLFQDIRNATDSVHVLFYIIRDDEISIEFCDILCEKAKSGCEVRVMLDRIGGINFTKKTRNMLKENGVHFSYTHRIKLPFLFFSFNHRNHRKITIIDGEIGYLGGFNMGSEYLGMSPILGFWRDYHLRMTGEGVADLQTQFVEDWKRETNEDLSATSNLFPKLVRGEIAHQFVTTNGLYLQSTFDWVLSQAKKEIFIATPYFVPSKELFSKLLLLQKQGILLHILVPQREDHPLVQEASLPYLETLIQGGADVHLFRDGFFHGKALIIDDKIVDIGTANFDLRSLFLNDEMNCIIFDEKFIEIFKHHLTLDMKASNPLDAHFYSHLTMWSKIKRKIAVIFLKFF